jgi:hypothetical protein
MWINHDHDLVDLTLTTTTRGEHGKAAIKTSEVLHTNQKHPFFTMEHGFLPVGQIKLRLEADDPESDLGDRDKLMLEKILGCELKKVGVHF